MNAIYAWHQQSNEGLDWWNALMWMASVKWAKRHFDSVALMASDSHRQQLDNLDIHFDEYHRIEVIDQRVSHVYEIPKLLALRDIKAPTLFIDHDAFIRRPLDKRVEAAQTIAEFRYLVNDWQRELNDSMTKPRLCNPTSAVCTGILGGNDVGQLNAFAKKSLESIAVNAAWASGLSGYQVSTVIGEVAAGTELSGMECLCNDTIASYRANGFIHIAGGKRDAGRMAMLAHKLQLDFPTETANLWTLYSALTE